VDLEFISNKASSFNETEELFVHDFKDNYSNANIETIIFPKHKRHKGFLFL
jgi:hypothetical protein